MKRPNQILSIAFLLVLLIGSSIFAVSATEYSVSEQSITSFGETLPDNVLFYPDTDSDNISYWAVDDYEYGYDASSDSSLTVKYNSYSAVNDATTTNYDPADPITPADSFVMAWGYINPATYGFGVYAEFDYQIPMMAASLDIRVAGTISETTMATTNGTLGGVWEVIFYNYQTSLWDSIHTVDSGWEWGHNVSIPITEDYINQTGNFKVKYCVFRPNAGYAALWIYNAFVDVINITGYAESFTDVSDWAESDSYPWEAGESISTDGDIGTLSAEGDGDNDIDGFYTNVSLVTVPYFEIRYKLSSLDADFVYLYCVQDGTDPHIALVESTEWVTRGVKIDEWIGPAPPTNPTEILIIIRADADIDIDMEIDYDRAGPVNESGWGHDGSTTQGIETDSSADWTYSYSTDGDKLTIEYNRTGAGADNFGEVYLPYDTTDTQCGLELDYYPLFSITYQITSFDASVDSYFWLYPKIDGKAAGVGEGFIQDSITAQTTGHMNAKAMTGSSSQNRLALFFRSDTQYDSATLVIDCAKAYSIANYTVTQSGAGTDDYLYVDSGILYCVGTSFTSITLDYDPMLSFETERSMWTMTTSSGTPEIDFYFDAWLGYTSNTEGDFPDGTLTDFRIKFTDSANVEAITFLSPIPQWNNVGEAELIFSVPIDESGLNMMLIFLGLAMIPASVLYLAKGGKSEMSSNKFYYGLIAFVMGWALFLGGIM